MRTAILAVDYGQPRVGASGIRHTEVSVRQPQIGCDLGLNAGSHNMCVAKDRARGWPLGALSDSNASPAHLR